jgi:hypothetical protein
MPIDRICAIHQPNFLPRLSTLAKLFASDVWVVLDDVQYNGRDYQNRCRLASLEEPQTFQWLSLPVHRQHGRATRICDVELVNQQAAYHRTTRLLRHYYRASRHWPQLDAGLRPGLEALHETNSVGAVATSSTLALLRLLDWRGRVLHSSDLVSRSGRSERLADLVRAVGANSYLCGTGGRRYLDTKPFAAHGVSVKWFDPPTPQPGVLDVWTGGRDLSALWSLAHYGIDHVWRALRSADSRNTSFDKAPPPKLRTTSYAMLPETADLIKAQ